MLSNISSLVIVMDINSNSISNILENTIAQIPENLATKMKYGRESYLPQP